MISSNKNASSLAEIENFRLNPNEIILIRFHGSHGLKHQRNLYLVFFLSPIMTRSSGHKSSFSNYNNNINESYIEGTFQDQSNRWNECAMPWHRLNAINNLLQATCSCPTTDCARCDCGFPAASRCSTPYLLCVMFTRITRPLMQSFTQMHHTDKPI